MNERNYQLQGSYTRYYDGLCCGYDSEDGPNKSRNFKTLESAVRAAKKEIKKNELPKVIKCEEEPFIDEIGRKQRKLHFIGEDGHEFKYGEKYSVWHIDGIRIVDRITQKILWES